MCGDPDLTVEALKKCSKYSLLTVDSLAKLDI